MESRRGNILSDAEWYCRKDPEEERFYEIFFQARTLSRFFGAGSQSLDQLLGTQQIHENYRNYADHYHRKYFFNEKQEGRQAFLKHDSCRPLFPAQKYERHIKVIVNRQS